MRVALVTGGSRGIGAAICKELAQMGMHVIINYNSNDAAADETVAAIKENDGSAEKLKFNVSNREEVRAAIENWKSTNPEQYIAAVVNNAGVRKDNLMVMMPDEDWDQVLDTSLGGFYNVTKPLLQDMVINKYGRIVNVASLSGLKGTPGQANYSAAKAALIGATKALAQEIGRKNITVNAVAPGFIITDMTEGIEEKAYKKIIPLGRFGTVEEVAKTVKFLVSDDSSYITGEVISINGGLYS